MSRRAFLGIAGVIAVVAFAGRNLSTDSASAVSSGASAPIDAAESQQQAARRNPEQFLEIAKFSWSKEGFGNVMLANFTIKNSSAFDLKDIAIRCTHAAPSGTVIDSNERTIYDIVKASSTRSFREFNMGFVHSQAKSSGCRVVSASLL
jgi:hypothetical protein